MDVLKLFLVFIAMIVVLRLKKPLFMAILAATVTTALVFQLPVKLFFFTLLESAISWGTLSILLIFYLIMFLQRMMEKRGSLILSQQSLDHLFHNRRITAALAPLFLGLLPSASVVLICGEIVDKIVDNDLTKEEKAFVTSYYRHIPEGVLPTYSAIILGLSLTGGVVSASSFILAMFPMVVLMVTLGYLFYLRKISKEIALPSEDSKRRSLLNLFKGIWPVLLIITLILALDIPVYIATIISIVLFAFVGRFRLMELAPFIKSSFEKNLLISTFFIMQFKDVLSATGVISSLPEVFATLPLPEFVIFALIFFFGTVVGGSQAIIVIGIPLAFMTITNAGLPLFVLLMGMTFIANQLTPTHVCLPIISEYFQISFGSLVKKSLPIVLILATAFIAYYFILILFV